MIRRISLFLCLVVALCLVGSVAICEEYKPTTDNEILFYGIPMNIGINEYKKQLSAKGIDFETSRVASYGDGIDPLSSSTFGDGEIISVAYSDYVDTTEYTFDFKHHPKVIVAGYPVYGIAVTCGGLPNKVFSVDISFKDDTDEQYYDLVNKLTFLYGKPYSYNNDNELGGYDPCNVWLGSNNTAVYIKLIHYSSYIDKSAQQYISLNYGSLSYNEEFFEEERRNIERENERKQQEEERIKNDFTGL